MLVGSKNAFGLQTLADLPFAGFQITQCVFGVNRIDLDTEAVQRFEDRAGTHQQLDAGRQLGTGGALKLGQDGVGGGLPDHSTGLGQNAATGIALGNTHEHMTGIGAQLHHFNQSPYTRAIDLSHCLGHTSQKTGQ